jgi:hypothetical protein
MKQMNKPVHNSISKTSNTTHYSSDYAERMGESYRRLNAHRAAIKLKSAAKLLLDRAEASPAERQKEMKNAAKLLRKIATEIMKTEVDRKVA